MSVTIPAGRINRLFGTDGGVMLSLYADFPAQFDTGTPLLVTIDALEVPLYCERFERRGTSGAVASFADFDTERRAQELVGLEFRIECDEDEDDEFYLEDLIGFAVTCTEAGADGAKGAAAFTGSVQVTAKPIRSRTTTTATPTRFSSWRSAAARCSSPPPRSSSPISTSGGAR